MEDGKNIKEISHEQDQDHQSIEQNTFKKDANNDEVLEDGNKAKAELEVGEKDTDIGSSKKTNQNLKPNPKTTKVTVPKPFSLATDKRKIARESRADVVKNYAPTLTRSRSMIYHRGDLPQVSNSGERNSVLSRSRSVKPTSQSSLPPKITGRKPVNTTVESDTKAKSIAQGSETEKKKPQRDSKVGGVVETKKQTKTSTFKALSLPSFYHKKYPIPTPETKRIPPGKDAKIIIPDKERKSVSITGDKGMVSRSVTSSAKETISKLLKTTQKNRTKPDETAKVAVVSNA